MNYTLVKVLHLLAMTTWVSGVIWQSRALRPARTTPLARNLFLNRFVVLPAMVLTWGLGLYLASKGGWFGAPWLSVKLAFVTGLSALCIVQSIALRRLASRDEGWWSGPVPFAGLLTLVAAASAIGLALLKPF
jgi:uncharacterized membrane protein